MNGCIRLSKVVLRYTYSQRRAFYAYALKTIVMTWGLSCSVYITSLRAETFYFDPRLLETKNSGFQPVDLSLFSKERAQLPGNYIVDIYVNNKKKTRRQIYFAAAKNGSLLPQFTPAILYELGIKVEDITALKSLDSQQVIPDIASYVPGMSANFDINHNKLDVSVPQIFLHYQARGYIDPARWDSGMPVAFTNYTFSGSHSRVSNSGSSERQYLNMQNGVNVGVWRIRNYSTWTHDADKSHWNSINTWLQRDIKSLKSQLVIGESATSGVTFPSYLFTGVQLASDENMQPNSLRGFAPTIRGIANSSAIVTVKQNGFTIYQNNVAPGAFEINDLSPTSFSGDLEVTIEEADGSIRRFIQPYSTLAVMQRPGKIKYSITTGRYRAAENENSTREPEFIEGNASYGVTNMLTLYGGGLFSQNYQAVGIGAGTGLAQLGSLSTDIGRADSALYDGKKNTGYLWRAQYIKDFDKTGTTISLNYYRYLNDGYFDFSESNQKDYQEDERSHDQLQISLNQPLLDGLSFYASGYQQTYWNSNRRDKNISLGLSGSLSSISYNLSYQYNDYSTENNDQIISFNMSIPLDYWLPHTRATYRLTNDNNGATQHEVGLNGTLLNDGRLNYTLLQRHSDNGTGNSSSLYTSYRSAYGTLTAGYEYGEANRQLNYGLAGGIVAHPEGVTLSQPLGSAFAIIDANGAANIRIQNYPGVATDYFGYAVIPFLTAYQENRITLDTTTLPDDVDISDNVVTVIPDKGAAVSAHFNSHIGHRLLLTLYQTDGSPVPFGAIANNEAQLQESIVDEGGVLYLSGINEKPQVWHIKWGQSPSQHCTVTVSLPASKSVNAISRESATCH